ERADLTDFETITEKEMLTPGRRNLTFPIGFDINLYPLRTGKRKMIKILIGFLAGALAGFLYYRFIGCRSGVCMITSNPYLSTLYWALLGGLMANIL
ncbi:MAG: hypothetical protein ACE5L7_09690, partial [Candidatus Aminicenantales bacterium]